MLTNLHEVSIIVNGEEVDIYSMEKLNLRMNNVVFDPVSINTKTGEYSFSFELPATSRNNKIFNYANNSAKLNKFNTRYNCEVVADGVTIFEGVLRLTDTQTENYKCNLVNIKVYNVDEIFGDMVMSDLVWEVDFNGTSTINTVNEVIDSGYYFPLVSYGAFQKDPKATYNGEINEYTDLLTIDSYNKWYWESFHPSLSLLEVVKRLFAQKGYTVTGDIFNDEAMKRIYMSEYIDSSQDPAYNLNKAEIGNFVVAGTFNNAGNTSSSTVVRSRDRRTGGRVESFSPSVISTFQDLTFPREPVGRTDEYNFDRINYFDVFATPSGSSNHSFTTPPSNPYLYRQNTPLNSSGFIYIPADGLYTIELTVTNLSIADNPTTMSYGEKYATARTESEIETRRTAIAKGFPQMPVEIQLVRNSNETELIGDIDISTNLMYPHEMDYTKYKATQRTTGGTPQSTGRGARRRTGDGTTYRGALVPDEIYFTRYGKTIAYDPYANPNFICGFTTMNDSPAVIKNGVSWNASVSDYNHSHFRCEGYVKKTADGTETQSEYNRNTLQCPNSDYFSATGQFTRNGKITCVVELKKNDTLFLEMITRVYSELQRENGGTIWEQGTYNCSFNYELRITPYTDKSDRYVNVQNMYYLPSQQEKNDGWGEKLRLGNFLNCKEKASDFINNFIKSFNIDYNQDGKSIIMNKAKKVIIPLNFIDIDDRVNTDEITFQRIDYPNSMQVKWSIDEEEAGAYRSIDTVEHQGAANWKDYIDRGSDKFIMDTTNENVDTSIESKFSYTWYQDFTFINFNRETFEDTGEIYNLRIPLISKDEYFIVQNDEAMKHDGLSLKQRLWFRQLPQRPDSYTLRLSFRMWNGDEVYITTPTDTYGEYTMNYKQQIGSIANMLFNLLPMTDSNFAIVECYLSPFEYNQIRNGSMVRVDNDLYVTSEVQGFDPTGNNLTTLKLIKVV